MLTKNTILFISDLHLSPEEPIVLNTFYYFLEHIAPDAESLYILGDFFESYIGDDDANAFTQSIIRALSRLRDCGVSIFLMHGNRDFLIGKQFAYQAGVTLISDPAVITHHHQKIVLMHGDSLCTKDKNHQRFRKIVSRKWIQKLFLSLPLSFRQKIAKQLRDKSMMQNRYKSREIMDVSEGTVESILKKYCAKKIIHGHTHRTMISEKRIVLGAWDKRGNYLRVDENGESEIIAV
ncbi:MAG: UDP-2,3-diacylglucosamine hydrolase [uncultured bacterium]|nr:MAG: UDP-2,3-diacylglucosamine hydrolase [uncultured bacterium]OGT34603.1 MAG: UDP-2,3-diacylglucosamine diphosphatase [Gammaproteobacteria bacterium RIFCSPHIGHO2_02_FULL_39_13]OGT50024.1 MAG: UDP-2,3-diacylglucosamine diphosphatase [Gammaproteobacteria bacterium RIFCSPHIGHO2_12_FULL_39_24]